MPKLISLILVPLLLATGYQRPDPFKNKSFTSFDYTVRDAKTGKVFAMKLDPKTVGTATWVFRGTVTDRAKKSVNLVLKVPTAEVDKIKLNSAGPGRVSIDGSDGEKSGYSLTYAATSGPGRKAVTYTGSLIGPRREESNDYRVVTDPGPLVIIAVVLVAALLCEAFVELNDCSNSQAVLRSIAACEKVNGKPKLTISTTFGVSFSPHFSVGCHPDCEFECR